MITFQQGNIFTDPAEALVNPINCVGTMGKGLALQFKERFPDNFREYARACHDGGVQPGRMLVHMTYTGEHPRYVINFPTKRHWRDDSQLEDITSGLEALAREIQNRRIRSVAIPALGSGLGGLDWSEVKPLIQSGLEPLENVRITVYEPVQRAAPRGSSRMRR